MDDCASSSQNATGAATDDPDPWCNSLAELCGTKLTAGGWMD
jgi:hypothetical protein